MTNFFGKCLIFDNNVNFIEKVKKQEMLLTQYPCLFSKTIKECQSIIKSGQHNIRAVFLSTTISDSSGLNELKEIKESRPHLPVILITHDLLGKKAPENTTGFSAVINSPKDYPELINCMSKILIQNEKWDDVAASPEEKFKELEVVDKKFVAIPVKDFIITSKSFFNIFIKLGPTKFVKVLNAGDPLQKELIENYLKKGIVDFYVTEEEQRKYLSLCEKISVAVLRKEEIPIEKKLKSLLGFGTNISNGLMTLGISPESLSFADSFLTQSLDLIKNMKIKNEPLKSLLVHIEKDHSAAVAFISGVIAKELGLESAKSVKLVGLASLVHDIGLYSLNPDFKNPEASSMTGAEQEMFDRHAQFGADILRSSGTFEEVVCLAVEQHHKRRQGNQSDRRSSNITLVSEIVGVADELFNVVICHDSTPEKINYFLNFTLKEFSPQVEKALVRILTDKEAA